MSTHDHAPGHDHSHGHDHAHPTLPDAAERLGYYQRWIRSITDNLLARGVISEAELADALQNLPARLR